MKLALYPKYLIYSVFVHDRHNFFKDGYKLLYPECIRLGMTPWQHYVIYGMRKGLSNGSKPADDVFFSAGYLLEYPDVKAAGGDPWRHYAEKGLAEGRDNGLHPKENEFFAAGYLEMYPDVAKANVDPWRHYVQYGKKKGRDNGLHPKENEFFAAGYLEMYPDVAKAKIDPWRHYARFGKKEGRCNGLYPNERIFSAERYCMNHPDVVKTEVNPWRHYVTCGRKAKNNYADDYAMRLAGHEQELVRTIYLAPHKSNFLKNIQSHPKVLLIGHELTISGAPLCLLSLAKILLSDEYHVDIAVKDKKNGSKAFMYDGIGADVFLLPDTTECIPQSDKFLINYDLVIVNTIVMGAYADLCRKLNIPHIWFVHEDLPSIRMFFRQVNFSEQRFFEDYENVLLVSKYVSDCVYNSFNIRCRYINNFVYDRFAIKKSSKLNIPKSFDSKGTITFAVVGGIESRKSQETAVAAFLSLSSHPKYKDRWKLFFIGKCGKNASNPALGIKLESATKSIPNIVWCGQVTEHKWELFSSIDFFIVPSLEESSSLVAIEAAMLGKPLVATTHVGAKYLVDNEAGFLFEPGNMAELRAIVMKCIDMTDDKYIGMSNQIRLNYEKTSSPTIYRSALSSIISEACAKCKPTAHTDGSQNAHDVVLRSMGTCANVIFRNNVEYINYADFACCKTHARDRIIKNSNSKEKNAIVGVVIPVYNGVEHLRALIPTLFRNTDLPHKFVFVDDSSNEETANYLADALSKRDDCVLIKNEINLGFVKSINKGADKALEDCEYFVMLNSDTEVPSGWLSRLIKPMLDDDKISSVTPLSNRCNIFSFPFFNKTENNDIYLKEFGLEGINEAIRDSKSGKYVDIPTGHGFCMAVSGKVWKIIGGLNELLFGRGYGEENEWSLRAELDGFRNVLTTSLYVAHHETGSFSSEEKKANCIASQQIISTMFPLYSSRVRDFIREYPVADSIVSIYLTLARQKGYSEEMYTDTKQFMQRLSAGDGIFVLKDQNVTKVAVKILDRTIMVGNAKNFKPSFRHY